MSVWVGELPARNEATKDSCSVERAMPKHELGAQNIRGLESLDSLMREDQENVVSWTQQHGDIEEENPTQ